jgi:inosine-uridine nucleoside N-ribohydrolase
MTRWYSISAFFFMGYLVKSVLKRPYLFVQALSVSPSNHMASSSTQALRKGRRRIIVDTDAGFDDIVAIQCLLAHGHNIELVTTVCGANTASATAWGLQRLFPQLTVVAGPNRQLRPTQDWLPTFRHRFADFVNQNGIDTSPEEGNDPSDDSCTHVYKLLEASADASVDLLCLGPLSNVADWYNKFPQLLRTKVRHIWMLGGSHPQQENQNEFNFGQDPKAAAAVVVSQLADMIRIVPGQVTSHLQVSDEYQQSLLQSIHTSSKSNLIAQAARIEARYSLYYDPVLCFVYCTPEAGRFVDVSLQVCPQTGQTKHAEEPRIAMVDSIDWKDYQAWLFPAITQSDSVNVLERQKV